MNITVDGQDYEITNWDDIQSKFLFALKELVVNRIQDEARKMRLWDNGAYIKDFSAEVDGDKLVISNPHEYSVYLEFGTLGYFKIHGTESWPSKPDPKKKNLKASEKSNYPRGMQPFAPVRKVLYNQRIMGDLFVKAWRSLA